MLFLKLGNFFNKIKDTLQLNTIEIMKAVAKYSSGLMLEIPKQGKAPMLFLEFISKYHAAKNIVHKVINLEDRFQFRLNILGEEYKEIAQYINDNL